VNIIVRIDERLIHGQVAYSWTVEYGVDRIIVVDDDASKNQIQKMALSLAVPPKKKFLLLDTVQGSKYLQENSSSTEKNFIVVKGPRTILNLINGGVDIKSVNVGGMYFVPGKQQISKTVYLNEDEKQIFLKLKDLGVEAEIRTSPKDKRLNLYDLI
jgi:mannose/fructose/N-acetylgalactosamine-specific phosphotransferase system component IIB